MNILRGFSHFWCWHPFPSRGSHTAIAPSIRNKLLKKGRVRTRPDKLNPTDEVSWIPLPNTLGPAIQSLRINKIRVSRRRIPYRPTGGKKNARKPNLGFSLCLSFRDSSSLVRTFAASIYPFNGDAGERGRNRRPVPEAAVPARRVDAL